MEKKWIRGYRKRNVVIRIPFGDRSCLRISIHIFLKIDVKSRQIEDVSYRKIESGDGELAGVVMQ